ncbi:MAG: hypothetical protein K2I64_05275 [Muribaculaceae bacterium]|nr:hypothetical protein [Muribaculaceae bacterium]
MNLFFRLIFILAAVGALTACNDEVFVSIRPEEKPDPVPPEENPEPVFSDSLVLSALEYIDYTTVLTDEIWELEGVTNFYNHDSQGTMYILLDNYNSTLVSISNSTYYVTPWAKEDQPLIDIPCLDLATETLYMRHDFIPFKFGITSVRGELRGGEKDSLTIPANTMVRATVHITRRKITASANITYYNTEYPTQSEMGWVNVVVWQPVDIRVVWSDVLPIEDPR